MVRHWHPFSGSSLVHQRIVVTSRHTDPWTESGVWVSARGFTILVLSDSTIIRTSIADALRATGRYHVIAGEAGENLALTSPPAAAIIDLSCSLLYGLGRATAPETRILVYGRRDRESLSSAIDLGADRFVSINATAEEIVNAVTEVLLGHDHKEGTSTYLSEFCGCEHRAGDARGGHRLTRREREVARLLAADYRNKEIAAELHLELSTVKTHVHSILRKLDLQSREDVRASAAQRQPWVWPISSARQFPSEDGHTRARQVRWGHSLDCGEMEH